MYSKIPMPQVEWTQESMQYCICFFPAVGAVIGAATLLWNMLVGAKLSGSLLFTAVLILIPVLITGGIHLDGLLDTADALSSYKTKEEKLEILKDSHAGAFAIIIGICWFVLDFGIYSEADAHTIGLLAIGFVISRTLSGLSLVSFRMAKNTGLAATFSEQSADRDDLLSDRMCRTFAVSGSTVRNGRADRGIAGIFLVPPFIL